MKNNDRIQEIVDALQSNKALVEIINERYGLNINYDFDLFEAIKQWLQAESEQQ